ncbi:MAG: IS66 family transposase [Actinomycetota bacterium]|nr:IS66 family transposase [Actinomycetota bacterium]
MADARDVAQRPSYEELAALVVELSAEVAELKARLAANSRNSSRPSSSDGLSKPSVDQKKRGLRRPSGRKQGGQEGHQGSRLDRAVPDASVEHPPERCGECGGDLAGAESVEGGESRQVFDVPRQRALGVIEHVATLRRCDCGVVSCGQFPNGVGAPTQYGPGVRAVGVYLHVFQHLPYDRACQALSDLVGAAVSTGTLTEWVTVAAAGLCDFDERLRALLADAPVAHFDETGARIAGRLGWVHSASTGKLTRYTSHERRGSEAIDHAAVLPSFTGVAVHDGWAPYRNYSGCEHGLCNIHHLRELQAAIEAGHTWPLAMSCLLLDTKTLVQCAVADGNERLDARAVAELAESYQTVIAMGHEEHPITAGKKTKAHNLLLRLERYQPDVLRFAHDFRVPFGNNQAEQDIRMVKLQQKISGCWRTTNGAQRFLRIRSYLSTTRKNGIGALRALDALSAGTPWLPASAPG